MNPRQFLYRIAFNIARSVALPHHDQMHSNDPQRDPVQKLGGDGHEPAQVLDPQSPGQQQDQTQAETGRSAAGQ
jgi:hypothetical protein